MADDDNKKFSPSELDELHNSVAGAAKFASLAFVMLVRQLEENGNLPRGTIERAIHDLLIASKFDPDLSWENKLSLHFFSQTLESFRRNFYWPRDSKPITLH